MGIALKGMCCVNKPPPQGLADTGNRRDIVSNNCVTCLYCHLQSTHMSFLVGHHTPSKCVHSHTHGAWQQLLLNVSPIPTNPQMHPSSNIASGGSSTVSGKSGHHSCRVDIIVLLFEGHVCFCAYRPKYNPWQLATCMDFLDSAFLCPFMMRQAYQNCTGMTSTVTHWVQISAPIGLGTGCNTTHSVAAYHTINNTLHNNISPDDARALLNAHRFTINSALPSRLPDLESAIALGFGLCRAAPRYFKPLNGIVGLIGSGTIGASLMIRQASWCTTAPPSDSTTHYGCPGHKKMGRARAGGVELPRSG